MRLYLIILASVVVGNFASREMDDTNKTKIIEHEELRWCECVAISGQTLQCAQISVLELMNELGVPIENATTTVNEFSNCDKYVKVSSSNNQKRKEEEGRRGKPCAPVEQKPKAETVKGYNAFTLILIWCIPFVGTILIGIFVNTLYKICDRFHTRDSRQSRSEIPSTTTTV